MKKIGVYCGSFSPVHKGHIAIAREVLKEGLADEVLIIATGKYWDKTDLLPLDKRIAMLELVREKGMVIDRRYNSYPFTHQIFEQLEKDCKDTSFSLIIGADNLPRFQEWKEYEYLLKYDFLVVRREGIDIDENMARLHKTNYTVLDLEEMPISSTYIRDHLYDYDDMKQMIDKRVYDYLKGNTTMQHEIIERHPLLDENGHLIETGYARSLILDYDRKAIKAPSLRIKEWDYYLVYNKDFGIALTVDDNSYMALDSISLLDFRKPWEHTNSPMKFMTLGKRNFPASSEKGDVRGDGKGYFIDFKKEEDRRVLSFRMDDFMDGKPIEGTIELEDPHDESMVIVTPYKESKVHFYYNQKINCMPAQGKVIFDGKEYLFEKENSFGTLDWGRGVWTYKNTWYWGSASGIVNGHRFGFNIGYGFGDTSAASENMLFWDGKAHKLSQVTFHIPTKDGKDDFLSPWKFTSDDGRFEMDFEPVMDRAANTDFIILGSDQHQVFGKFTGTCILDDGTKVEIKDLLGFAEKVANKW